MGPGEALATMVLAAHSILGSSLRLPGEKGIFEKVAFDPEIRLTPDTATNRPPAKSAIAPGESLLSRAIRHRPRARGNGSR